jgi:hypothetical protein
LVGQIIKHLATIANNTNPPIKSVQEFNDEWEKFISPAFNEAIAKSFKPTQAKKF